MALLGPSGAGKSTLAALALKVVAPRSGHVLLGGVEIASLPAALVRARIGWLGQTTHCSTTPSGLIFCWRGQTRTSQHCGRRWTRLELANGARAARPVWIPG